MLKRDPKDRRYRERVAGSYLASLVLHAMLAALLFAVVANSSQEGASESVSGGTLVTIEKRAPVIAQVPVPAQQAAPVPHAPRIAPVQHAPLTRPARQPQPPVHHELSKFAPTAPPNPTPLPQASAQPNPQPTRAIFEPKPETELPAVPTSVPTAPLIAVTVKIPPTAAPSPVPTAAPTARPTPSPPPPTAAPTVKPQTPAPAPPTVVPTAVAVVPRAAATATATASPQPVARPSGTPAARLGVPSPSPTQGAALAKTSGAAPSPAPKGLGSPGPRPGNAGTAKPGPSRPVSVAPTASPRPSSGAGGKPSSGVDINAKLRAMLPNNPVNPDEKSYHQSIGLGNVNPTPPPDVVAMTKYIFEATGVGDQARVKMWVTSVRRDGPLLICEGWLLRYPRASQPAPMQGTIAHPIPGGIVMSAGGNPGGTLAPIVEEHASTTCRQRSLVPYAPSPAPSP